MSKINIQNLPSSPRFMRAFVARPNHKIVYTDFDALEFKVAAHLTQDKSLMSLYGPNAKPNDAHLFNAANMRLFADEIQKYYNPLDPTPEGIRLAKENCHTVRQIVKMAGYAMSYGAQPPKIYDELRTAGYDVTLRDAHQIFDDYWNTYSGIVRFTQKLQQMWQDNGRWVYNGRGRPLCVPGKYKKDLYNRVVQATGHDCLMRYVEILDQRLTGLEAYPWDVDKHDATAWEVHEDQAEEVKEMMQGVYPALNSELQWTVDITGDVKIADNLGELVG